VRGPQRCRLIGKCHVNGMKCKKEVSSSIITPIYPFPMLAGCVDAPRGYRCSRQESTLCHTSTRTASCRFRQSQKKNQGERSNIHWVFFVARKNMMQRHVGSHGRRTKKIRNKGEKQLKLMNPLILLLLIAILA
jgi:hypothetical protein